MARISETQTIPSFRYRGSGDITLRITASVTCTDENGHVIVGAPDFYVEADGAVDDNVLTIEAYELPPTDLSSKSSALTYTGKIYVGNALKQVLFTKWRLDSSLGDAILFKDWEADNLTLQRPLGDNFYNKTQINVRLNALVNMANKATTVSYGGVRMLDPPDDIADPTGMSPNSVFIQSSRTLALAALPAESVREGTRTKLTDGFQGEIYDNGATFGRSNLGIYDPLNFGARDDGGTDCWHAIGRAMEAAVAEGGGTIRLVKSANGAGLFRISAPLVIPSKVTIEGDGFGVDAAVKLVLDAHNSHAIEIGEGLDDIRIRNLAIKTEGEGNTAFLFTGSVTPTQRVFIDDVGVMGFDTPFKVLATDISKAWQCSYISVRNLTAYGCLTAVKLDSLNCDISFYNLTGYVRTGGIGIDIDGCAHLLFEHARMLGGVDGAPGSACSAGTPNPVYSEAMMRISGQHGIINVIGSQQEGFRDTLQQDFSDLTYPINFTGNNFGAPIRLNQACIFNSNGNFLFDNSVIAQNDARVFSEGDFVSSLNTCLDAGSGLGGFVCTDGAFVVKRNTIYGSSYHMRVCMGSTSPDGTNPLLASTPILDIDDVGIADKIYLAISQMVAGVKTLRYKLTRNSTTGYLRLQGTQASPNKGYQIDGPLEMEVDASATAPTGTKARVNWTGALFQLLTASATFNFIVASTVLTAGKYMRAAANGRIENGLWEDNGTNVKLVSGLLQFLGTTASFPALKRVATALSVRLADDSADGPLTAAAGTFSGLLSGAGVKSTAGVSNFFHGANVASAAAIVPTGNSFHVTGTTTITSINGAGLVAGTVIRIIFDGILTLTDGSNLKLAGDFVTSADDTITLQFDGTNFYELGRSVN